ncbi:MAG: transglycosylase SLT domain-containing protein [Burkholderiaceae bacterium]
MPAQRVGAIDHTAPAAAAPIASRSTSSSGSDIDRYQELTEIGGKAGAPASPEELEQAYLHYCRAAGNGSTDALVRLGWMHLNGLGVKQDDAVAGALLRRASAYGSQLAGQLLMMVRGRDERMPECIGDRVLANAIVEPAQPIARGSNRISDPARFSTVPASLERQRLAAMVIRIAADFRLDPRLIMALIGTESNFDPNARSPKDAFGLMQLIPETAARFQVADVLDPAQNLRGGMAYMSWLLSYYRGDVILALAAYNAGEGAVDRHKGVPPYPETMAYVQRIRALYPVDRHAFNTRLTTASPILGAPTPTQTAGLGIAGRGIAD